MARRPIRSRMERGLSRVPSGPLGKVGNGNVAGAAGYFAIESVKNAVDLVPGVREPGWNITGHGVEDKNGFTDHILTIDAISKNVAVFAAKYYAPPSNIDYITSEVDVVSIKLNEERSTYNSYEVVVRVDERGRIER